MSLMSAPTALCDFVSLLFVIFSRVIQFLLLCVKWHYQEEFKTNFALEHKVSVHLCLKVLYVTEFFDTNCSMWAVGQFGGAVVSSADRHQQTPGTLILCACIDFLQVFWLHPAVQKHLC